MGTYLNPGAKAFQQGRNSQIYVDKSELLSYLNLVLDTERRFVCVSRPRRFGKTMAANMVCAYYDRTVDGAAEFAGLKIADDAGFDEHRGRYDVLHINMQEFLSATHDVGKLIDMLSRLVVREIQREHSDLDILTDMGLPAAMADSYAQTGTQFVIVIDEWDCPMREMKADHDAQERYLDFLRAWLKDKPYVALCYMTGILPIKKYGTHSALNMFSEFSMTSPRQMAPFVGFTEDEVQTLCREWNRDFDECRAWYDGYRLEGTDGLRVEAYSPKSVVEAMISGIFESYWSETETYEALKRYIDMDMDGLRSRVVELMGGGRVAIETRSYANDMTTFATADDVLTLLVHLGYLGYDSEAGEAFVPNREVFGEFAVSTRSGGWDEVARSIRESESLLTALVAGDVEAVAAGVERAHEDAASVIAYNGEASLAATLRLAFYSAIRRWRLVREMPAGKGYADLVLIPLASAPAGTPGVIIELKYDATADEALAQVRERGYGRALEGLAAEGNVVLCGIAYDPKTKRHACLIERA